MGTDAYVPSWIFSGCYADIVEWDGTHHTVKVYLRKARSEIGGLFQSDALVEYCDGARHLIPLAYLLYELRAEVHRFGWTHFYSGGGSKYYNLPFFHAAGCQCNS